MSLSVPPCIAKDQVVGLDGSSTLVIVNPRVLYIRMQNVAGVKKPWRLQLLRRTWRRHEKLLKGPLKGTRAWQRPLSELGRKRLPIHIVNTHMRRQGEKTYHFYCNRPCLFQLEGWTCTLGFRMQKTLQNCQGPRVSHVDEDWKAIVPSSFSADGFPWCKTSLQKCSSARRKNAKSKATDTSSIVN